MKVKTFMTKDPITVDADTTIMKAHQIMREHNIKRLPVTKNGKFVGLVSSTMIAEASPSKASRLSVHELNYIISKMTVGDIYLDTPITISPDYPIEEAILLGKKHGIGGFPVIDENNNLVGILSTTDVAKVVIEALGLSKRKSTRIHIELPDDTLGAMAKIIEVLDNHKIPLLSLLSLPIREKKNFSLILRVSKMDVSKAVEDLKATGINVVETQHIEQALF
jgi:acetoin utilization protein AcuB